MSAQKDYMGHGSVNYTALMEAWNTGAADLRAHLEANPGDCGHYIANRVLSDAASAALGNWPGPEYVYWCLGVSDAGIRSAAAPKPRDPLSPWNPTAGVACSLPDQSA